VDDEKEEELLLEKKNVRGERERQDEKMLREE
jgi:hypothetical protein